MLRSLVLAIAVLTPSAAVAAPAIHLHDGSVVRGEIVSLADGKYTVETSLGSLVIAQALVRRIEYVDEAPKRPAPVSNPLRVVDRLGVSGAVAYHQYRGVGWNGGAKDFDSPAAMGGVSATISRRGAVTLDVVGTAGWYGGSATDDEGYDYHVENAFFAVGPRASVFLTDGTFVFTEAGIGMHKSTFSDGDPSRGAAPSGHLAGGVGFRSARSLDLIVFGRFIHAPVEFDDYYGTLDMGGYEFGTALVFRPGSLLPTW